MSTEIPDEESDEEIVFRNGVLKTPEGVWKLESIASARLVTCTDSGRVTNVILFALVTTILCFFSTGSLISALMILIIMYSLLAYSYGFRVVSVNLMVNGSELTAWHKVVQGFQLEAVELEARKILNAITNALQSNEHDKLRRNESA